MSDPVFNQQLICNHSDKHHFVDSRLGIYTREQPQQLGTRHNPVPFTEYIGMIEEALFNYGWNIDQYAYCIDEDGQELTGSYAVRRGLDEVGYWTPTVVFMGSHNQTLPRRLAVGTFTFACTNKALIADLLSVKTKQTTNIEDRLPIMVNDAIAKLEDKWQTITRRYNMMRFTSLSNQRAYELFVKALRLKILSPNQFRDVIEEWHNPTHPSHSDMQSAWGAYNAMTYVLGQLSNPNNNMRRSQKIDQLVTNELELNYLD